jgi:MATE family multidrug resistance protein
MSIVLLLFLTLDFCLYVCFDGDSRAAATLLALVPYEIVDCMNCVAQGIFRGIGHQNIAARINAIAYYIVGIPLGAWMAFQLQWSLEGLWIGFAIGIFTSLATSLYILSRSNWKQLALEAQERCNE